jgi:hypothetical protein
MTKLKLTGDSAAVKARQRVEQTIALTTVKALLDAGFLLGVDDGEETTIHHSRNFDKLKDALFTTDEDWLLVYLKGDDKRDIRPQYWVRFVYGNDGWDVISDYTTYLEPYIGKGTVVEKLVGKLENDYDPSLLMQ